MQNLVAICKEILPQEKLNTKICEWAAELKQNSAPTKDLIPTFEQV